MKRWHLAVLAMAVLAGVHVDSTAEVQSGPAASDVFEVPVNFQETYAHLGMGVDRRAPEAPTGGAADAGGTGGAGGKDEPKWVFVKPMPDKAVVGSAPVKTVADIHTGSYPQPTDGPMSINVPDGYSVVSANYDVDSEGSPKKEKGYVVVSRTPGYREEKPEKSADEEEADCTGEGCDQLKDRVEDLEATVDELKKHTGMDDEDDEEYEGMTGATGMDEGMTGATGGEEEEDEYEATGASGATGPEEEEVEEYEAMTGGSGPSDEDEETGGTGTEEEEVEEEPTGATGAEEPTGPAETGPAEEEEEEEAATGGESGPESATGAFEDVSEGATAEEEVPDATGFEDVSEPTGATGAEEAEEPEAASGASGGASGGAAAPASEPAGASGATGPEEEEAEEVPGPAEAAAPDARFRRLRSQAKLQKVLRAA